MKHNPYLKELNKTVFDIETTGLSARRDRMVCASFCDPSDGTVLQFFADSPSDEKELIEKTIRELARCQAVITYNGASFDLPFLNERAKKYGISTDRLFFWTIDLYRWIRTYWPAAAALERLNLSSVESALGLSEKRADLIEGVDCIELYARWCREKNAEAKEKILLHNGDDVRQLARIGYRMTALPYHRIAFENGFFINGPCPALIGAVTVKKNRLSAAGKIAPGRLPAAVYEEAYQFSYEPANGNFELTILLEEAMQVKYADLKALPVEETEFTELRGFHDGFLIIEENTDVLYKEANLLIRKITEKCCQMLLK